MKFKDLVAELEASPTFQVFAIKHPEAFLAAGFFILDLAAESTKVQLDYYVPSEQQVAGFEHPFKEVRMFTDTIKEMTPLSVNLGLDLDGLEDACKKAIVDHGSSLVPSKIIAVLKGDTWNLTCMNDALGIVRMHFNAITGHVEDFDKGSLMDFMGFKKV